VKYPNICEIKIGKKFIVLGGYGFLSGVCNIYIKFSRFSPKSDRKGSNKHFYFIFEEKDRLYLLK